MNVARAAALCGAKVQAGGLAGGFNGQQLEALLEKDGIPYHFVPVQGETRCCINILDPEYGSTEYLEPGCRISPEEEQTFLQEFPKLIQESDVITISGSLPQGMSKHIYASMITTAKEMGKMVLLDTSGELLKNGITATPTFVKPNQNEIEQLYGIQIHSVSDVIACAQKMHEEGIPYVVISLGKDGALLVCEDGIFQAVPPKIEPVNTVGCGDSMVGAFAAAFERKEKQADALRYAASVATANALSPDTGRFDPKVQEHVYQQTIVKKL